MREAKALTRLCICAVSSELTLLADEIGTKFSRASPLMSDLNLIAIAAI